MDFFRTNRDFLEVFKSILFYYKKNDDNNSLDKKIRKLRDLFRLCSQIIFAAPNYRARVLTH